MIDMTLVKIGDRVRVNRTVEVEPLNRVYEGTIGEVIDTTCPDYAKVKAGYRVFWIDCKYLTVIDKIND
jgi:hypothetical protein